MDRCLSSHKGFTLLEIIMTIAIGAVVLISAADLLINFANYTSNVIKAESSLMDTSLGAFEEIVDNISRANSTALGSEIPIADPSTPFPAGCALNNTCIQVRVDTNAVIKTPSVYSDDIVYSYYLSAGAIIYRAIGAGAGVVIARNVTTLTFSRPVAVPVPQNAILIIIEGQAQSGATGGVVKEHLETTVFLRSRGV
ncbi:MAG: prepilin-type N-terminal cleavage/methylation domain-containing protein [Candidatus Omnitrophota bacterium]